MCYYNFSGGNIRDSTFNNLIYLHVLINYFFFNRREGYTYTKVTGAIVNLFNNFFVACLFSFAFIEKALFHFLTFSSSSFFFFLGNQFSYLRRKILKNLYLPTIPDATQMLINYHPLITSVFHESIDLVKQTDKQFLFKT